MHPQPTPTKRPDGATWWQLPDGTLHRDNGPAITHPDGFQAWYKNGQEHRAGDLPAVCVPQSQLERTR